MTRAARPGHLALAACIAVTSVWTFWGVTEMFHEGWYAPFEWLWFLLPAGISLALTLVALRWPRVGGWLLIGVGVGFYAWVLLRVGARHGLSLGVAASWFPVAGFLAVVGWLFLRSARARRAPSAERSAAARGAGRRRDRRVLLAVGVPLLVGLATAVEPAIRVAGRVDDGFLGARRIDGLGVALVWAPAGPGWTSGVSWEEIAGDADVCRSLSDDGARLEATPQDRWRLPTADEVVRSLVRHGENAGCTWDGGSGAQDCAVRPDKETPLWDPGSPIIYLWTADEASATEAYAVTYHGAVWAYPKDAALGSLGFRCVRGDGGG